MTTCKEESTRWVHRYAAGGAAFAAIPLPLSTSAGLVALETHLVAMIGEIYGERFHTFGAAAAGGAFTTLGQALKWTATQASLFVPLLGVPIRMGIAGGTIEAIGHAVIAHFERRHPGRSFEREPPAATANDNAEA